MVEEKDRKMSDDEGSERAECKRQHAAIMRNRIKNELYLLEPVWLKPCSKNGFSFLMKMETQQKAQ